ncbi:HIT family protein [Paenisporosarcina antarctica]|uniref:HIT family protein n=1 Tax=Paenisporosarcina antarctica TaxID=417367 RepID=UPI002ADD4F8C|nr:HIT family protein [Paenisporosarcina antarctica]
MLPKKHFGDLDELDLETAIAIMEASQLLSIAFNKIYKPEGITICQDGGILFNDLSNYHLHEVPRYENQSFASFYTEEPWSNEDIKNKMPSTRDELVKIIGELLVQ